jgi:hypothetical protein
LSNIELDGHEFVDASGAPTPGSKAFYDWMQQTLDDYVAEKLAAGKAGSTGLKGTYVMAYDPATDRAVINVAQGSKTVTNLYGESCRYCAERVSADELGVPVNKPFYSDARQIEGYQKPIRGFGPCTQCQVDMDPPQFKPDTKFYKGGRFEQLKILGKVSTAFKWAGRGFAVLGVAADIYDVATAPDGQKVQTAVKDTSALAGALAGGEMGAEWGMGIGSLIEPVGGTVVGGIIGGVVGGIIGGVVGSGIGDSLNAIGDTISSWF